MSLRITRGNAADLAFVMTTERRDGYEALVGRWEEAQHRAAIANPAYAYLIARDGQDPVGFAIVRDWGSPERVTQIKRIAVIRPGQGYGRELLHAVVDGVFNGTEAHRLWLGVFPANIRARRSYEAVGFVAEGIARGSAWFGGTYRDELIMALLRPDWRGAATGGGQ